MISHIGLAGVVCLILWILFSQPRRSELLLVLPFIFQSNFFGFLPYRMFKSHGFIRQGDVVFALLLLLVVVFIGKSTYDRYNTRPHKVYMRLAGAFVVFLVAEFVLSLLQYGYPLETFKVFSRFLRYASVFVFVYILGKLDIQQVNRLLLFIENLTIVLAALYVLNFGFGIHVFAIESFQEFRYGGQQLFRNFLAIPTFSIFVLSILLLKREFTLKSVLGLVIIVLALLLSYTRDMLFSVSLVVLSGILLWFFYYGVRSKRVALVGIGLLVIGGVSATVFNGQVQYFLSRINEIQESGGIEGTENFLVRQNIIVSRAEMVLHSDPVLGAGFLYYGLSTRYHLNVFTRAEDLPGQLIVGDQSWGNFIGSIGFGGCALFLFLFFYPVYYIIRNRSFRQQNTVVYAALLALFVELFVRAFFSSNLTDSVFEICLYFALIDYFISFDGPTPAHEG